MSMPPQNFVTGDADGNIGWTIAGKIPRKTGFNADAACRLERWSTAGRAGLSPAEYPRIVNPESGRIWTANARVADADALRIIGDGGYDLGARARQIRDGLFAKDTFDAARTCWPSSMTIARCFCARWRDLLLEVLDDDALAADDPELAEYRALVAELDSARGARIT